MRPERDTVLALLRAHQEELRQMGVRTLSLFGSVARDEAGADSDVDLLVEFEGPYSLFDLGRLEERLSAWTGARVDLVPRLQLRHELEASVLHEAIRAA